MTQPVQPGPNGHLDTKFFSVRNDVVDGLFRIIKVASDDNLADVLVTFKNAATFHRLMAALMGHCPIDPPGIENEVRFQGPMEILPPNHHVPSAGGHPPAALPHRGKPVWNQRDGPPELPSRRGGD